MVDFKTFEKLHPYHHQNTPPADDDIADELQNSGEPPKKPFLLLLPRELKGYNLRTKKWGQYLYLPKSSSPRAKSVFVD